MTIEEGGVVDIIVGRDGGGTVLVVADHLDWTDEEGHLRALQEKLLDYVEGVDTGQLDGWLHPGPVEIQVVTLHSQPEKAARLALQIQLHAQATCARLGDLVVTFTRLRPDDADDEDSANADEEHVAS
jgi:hypothetical protein